MADNKTENILSPFDNIEKHDIITDEELEKIGAAYGSSRKYERTRRDIAVRLSGTPMGRNTVYGRIGTGSAQARRPQGTSTVPLGDLSRIKKINIAGKTINSPGDAAQIFSAFRDPRIEIFNVAYTSKTGEVLAHTAWTSGLPGFTRTIDGDDPDKGISKIIEIKETLNAYKIWIAHNHPSGNPAPSEQDIGVTRLYASHFGDAFAGHIVLDHDKYTFIAPNGVTLENKLEKPVNNFNWVFTLRRYHCFAMIFW